MGYTKEAFKGLSWMTVLRGSTRIISFIKIVVLARILTPEEFGLFGIASLALSFLEIVTETGINVFLIQEKEDLKKYLNTAWVVSIIRGIVISFFLIILAIPISLFFKSPESRYILIIIGIVPFLRGFINPSIVKFQKELNFRREFYFRLIIFSFDAIVTLCLAYILKSAFSLVWGLISGVVLEIIISWLYIKPKPKFYFELESIKKVVNRGKWITLSGIFNYLFQQGDDIVVGRILNTYSLGMYQIAYKLSTLPITEGGEILHKVFFPVYVKISDDKERLKKAFLKVIVFTSIIVLPLGMVIYLFPEMIVLFILGEKWIEIVPVLKILVVYAVLRSITSSASPVFLAVRKQKYITIITLVGILGLAVCIIPLVKNFGILGAGYAALISWLIVIPIIFFYLYKVFK
ncbi:hypothetical protein A2892_02175 [Candidatus Woesebacteria bacterium RIFCSPLOWO2_01_FULL_39_10b]|uniref:Uncharacterized protein n=1 Tax=Candidatus Woesebacteria bacterium RIFCSPLOWO2_01_FULL_39_10b TaxID=1802517 RepID=A0A1F8B5W6_9BACT|nr:MAG: hypothetical protein A2892_02175 [Candidatus Woesebacteria bacterium RIFCSPLOWO2_01_FULL_39_10b]